VRGTAKGDVITAEADDVRRTPPSSLKSIPIGDIRPNAKVMAKYALDGKWYAARIEGKVPGGWSVTYTSYSNTEIVPYEYIKATPKTAEVLLAGGSARSRPRPLPAHGCRMLCLLQRLLCSGGSGRRRLQCAGAPARAAHRHRSRKEAEKESSKGAEEQPPHILVRATSTH
jgi:hypothetical protein